MTQDEPYPPQRDCDKCGQKESCQDIYRQLGSTKEKSVICPVLSAFLLPLVVFIAALAAAQRLLRSYIVSEGLRTVISLLSAVAVAAVCVITVKIISKRPGRKKDLSV